IPLNVWLLTPWMRPFRWSRLLLTYLLPILPLLIAWDGLVSHLRAYSADDLRALAAEVHVPGYAWETGTLRARGAPLTYILGIPHHD
ncbi:MAG: class I SAM-dependent methyltransferase, partial [Anaerolineae bacterium]